MKRKYLLLLSLLVFSFLNSLFTNCADQTFQVRENNKSLDGGNDYPLEDQFDSLLTNKSIEELPQLPEEPEIFGPHDMPDPFSDCLNSEYEERILPVSKNLKYFGVLSSNTSDAIDLNSWKTNTLSLLKMGNLHDVEFIPLANDDKNYSRSIKLLIQKIVFLKERNSKVVLWVQAAFFDQSGQLKQDYKTTWAKLNAAASPLKSIIKGIYLFDKPFWTAQTNHIPLSVMYDRLTVTGQLIKSSFSAIPLIYIEAYPMVNASLNIPAVFDWIGMECYGSFESCGDDVYGRKSIPEYYQILKDRIAALNLANKKFVVIPGSALADKYSSKITPSDRVNIIDVFRKLMTWVIKEPDVVAVMSFLNQYNRAPEPIMGFKLVCQNPDFQKLFWHKFKRLSENSTIPAISCVGTGIRNSYSMKASIKISNFDAGLPGYFFFVGHDVVRNEWYFNWIGRWVKYTGKSEEIAALSGGSLADKIDLTLFNDNDLSSNSINEIYVGYGIGPSKMEALRNMISNPSQFKNCQALPEL